MATPHRNRPPYPPLAGDGVVVDLRPEAPPPPGLRHPQGNGDELWIRIDLTDPEGATIHPVAAPPPPRPVYPLQLIDDEPLPLGLRRVTVASLDDAVTGLRHGDAEAARVAVGRTRSALRAVRTWIGEDVYRSEDAVLGYVHDMLQPLISAGRRADHAAQLADRLLDAAAATSLVEGLRAEHDVELARTVGDPQATADLVTTISTSRARFSSWPVHAGVAVGTRRVPIPDAFSSISAGIEDSYERGRAAFRTALEQPIPARLHEWRAEVRHLRFQLEMLHGAWPAMLGGVIATLESLDELLTSERSLGDLAWRVTTPPLPVPADTDQHTMVLEIERTRFRTRRRSFDVGRRIYLEEPDAFLGRMAGYWMAWRRHRRAT